MTSPQNVAPDVAYLTTQIVNLVFIGRPDAFDREWVLVDTGMPGSADRIARAAGEFFGPASRPAAIILTHGHFDHVGAVRQLASRWDAPVYAHPLEMPYLTGLSSYPPADPTVGGGAMARLSPLFPRQPINISDRVLPLPADGIVPGLAAWRWLHTPGHAPGHVSLFRDADRTLIAGDAFVTVKQESATAVLTKKRAVHGPPAYYTIDWDAARHSVEVLASLRPQSAITGHGLPMHGEELREQLDRLALHFDRLGQPRHGRYVGHPVRTDVSGVLSIPPPVPDPMPKIVAGVAAAALAGAAFGLISRRAGRHVDE